MFAVAVMIMEMERVFATERKIILNCYFIDNGICKGYNIREMSSVCKRLISVIDLVSTVADFHKSMDIGKFVIHCSAYFTKR